MIIGMVPPARARAPKMMNDPAGGFSPKLPAVRVPARSRAGPPYCFQRSASTLLLVLGGGATNMTAPTAKPSTRFPIQMTGRKFLLSVAAVCSLALRGAQGQPAVPVEVEAAIVSTDSNYCCLDLASPLHLVGGRVRVYMSHLSDGLDRRYPSRQTSPASSTRASLARCRARPGPGSPPSQTP